MKAKIFPLIGFITATVLFWTGCAGILSSMQSASHKTISNPPYVKNFGDPIPATGDSIQVFPIVAPQEENWYSPSLSPLLDSLNAYLFRNQFFERVEMPPFRREEAPEIRFGHVFSVLDISRDEEKDYENTPMVLLVRQPSRNWSSWWQEYIPANVDFTIRIKLEIGAYKVSQKDWKGNKEIRIGTGYRVAVPWLTAQEDPVAVVQLIGALISKEGKVVRAGAEGIFVKPNSFIKSVIGIPELINNEDVETIIFEHKRTDLEHNPLAYKVALQNLIANLSGNKTLIME